MDTQSSNHVNFEETKADVSSPASKQTGLTVWVMQTFGVSFGVASFFLLFIAVVILGLSFFLVRKSSTSSQVQTKVEIEQLEASLRREP